MFCFPNIFFPPQVSKAFTLQPNLRHLVLLAVSPKGNGENSFLTVNQRCTPIKLIRGRNLQIAGYFCTVRNKRRLSPFTAHSFCHPPLVYCSDRLANKAFNYVIILLSLLTSMPMHKSWLPSATIKRKHFHI